MVRGVGSCGGPRALEHPNDVAIDLDMPLRAERLGDATGARNSGLRDGNLAAPAGWPGPDIGFSFFHGATLFQEAGPRRPFRDGSI